MKKIGFSDLYSKAIEDIKTVQDITKETESLLTHILFAFYVAGMTEGRGKDYTSIFNETFKN